MKIYPFFALWGLAAFISFGLTYPSLSLAQSRPRKIRLPPPPPVRNLSSPPASSVPIPSVPTAPRPSSAIREYIFQSPQAESAVIPKKPNPTSRPSPASVRGTARLYRVEVPGESKSLLSQVRVVEPLAFVRAGGGVIHAGVFQQQAQAQQRVGELKKKGVSAKVVAIEDRKPQQNVSTQRLVHR